MAQKGPAGAGAKEPLLLPPHHPSPPPCYGVPVGDYEPPPAAQPYVLVPLRPPRRRRRPPCGGFLCSSLLALLALALLLGVAGILLWPSAPDVRLARLDLLYIRVSAYRHGGVRLDVDMGLRARLRNPNRFNLHSERVTVEVGYRGRRLGAVDVGSPEVRARGESYVEARLRLEEVWVLEDAGHLVEDMARGRIPLVAVTTVKVRPRFFGLVIAMQGRLSCTINVDVENQIIASQDCYADQRTKEKGSW